MADESQPADRAFVLGLDGVPWGKLTEWIDAGHLPNFERLRETGAAGPFESTMPPTTALAWPSIATGVWPDKHGVYGFRRLEHDYTHPMSTRRDVSHPTLWDQLSPAVVGNVPLTYPAQSIDGDLVTGMMTPEMNDQFTHPPSLGDEIRERIPEYRIGLSWNEYGDRPDEFVRDLEDLVAARRALMELLMEREDWRLFFFVYTAPDRLQHLRWEEDVLIDHYRFLDEVLGEVMDYVEANDANLFVVSDHGFGPVEKHVAVNTALKEAGYLAPREQDGTRSLLATLGISKDSVRSLLDRLGVDEGRLLDVLPARFVEAVAEQVPGSHSLYDVDFSRTQAFVHSTNCVYVNDVERFDRGTVDPADRSALKARLRETFESITDPETGERVLVVSDGDELFEADEGSPDLVVRGADGYTCVTGLEDEVVAPFDVRAASHRSEGVFFAWGPDVHAGVSVEDATVVDLAPTVLQSLGEAIPTSADGAPLEEILRGSATPTERVVTQGGATEESGDDDFGDVEDRLRGLGYLD